MYGSATRVYQRRGAAIPEARARQESMRERKVAWAAECVCGLPLYWTLGRAALRVCARVCARVRACVCRAVRFGRACERAYARRRHQSCSSERNGATTLAARC